jgi:hypothetical protein
MAANAKSTAAMSQTSHNSSCTSSPAACNDLFVLRIEATVANRNQQCLPTVIALKLENPLEDSSASHAGGQRKLV